MIVMDSRVTCAVNRGEGCTDQGSEAINSRHSRRCFAQVQGLGARFGIYFGIHGAVNNYRDVVPHQRHQMLRFIKAAIEHGVYFHDYGGAACHHGFCAAMTINDVHEALRRLDAALGSMR